MYTKRTIKIACDGHQWLAKLPDVDGWMPTAFLAAMPFEQVADNLLALNPDCLACVPAYDGWMSEYV